MTKPLDPGIKTPSTALFDITNFSTGSRKIKKGVNVTGSLA